MKLLPYHSSRSLVLIQSGVQRSRPCTEPPQEGFRQGTSCPLLLFVSPTPADGDRCSGRTRDGCRSEEGKHAADGPFGGTRRIRGYLPPSPSGISAPALGLDAPLKRHFPSFPLNVSSGAVTILSGVCPLDSSPPKVLSSCICHSHCRYDTPTLGI